MADELAAAEEAPEPEIADEIEEVTNEAEATDQVEDAGEVDDEDADTEQDADEDQTEEEIEYDSFDFGGDSLEIPKGAVPDELRDRIEEFNKKIWTNYGEKTRAIAEQTKAVEAREQAATRLLNLQGEALESYSRGLAVKQELDQLQQIDMAAMWRDNPDQARQYSDAISQRTAEYQRLHAQVQASEQAIADHQASETARLTEEGKAAVEKRIKGFEAKAPEVIDYVTTTYGIDRKEAETWPLNPAAAEMAYKSMMWDRMQANAKKKPPAKQPEKPIAPSKGTGGRQRSTQPQDSDDVQTWLRKRQRQLGRASQ